jgi:hypothetical protein
VIGYRQIIRRFSRTAGLFLGYNYQSTIGTPLAGYQQIGMMNHTSVTAVITAMLVLYACQPADTTKAYTPERAEAAYSFAQRLQGSIGPILDSQTGLENFALQTADDLQTIRADRLNAMGDALSILFDDLGDYLFGALTVDNDGNIMSVDWQQLPITRNNQGHGIFIQRSGTVITVTGTGIVGHARTTNNSIDASFVISLSDTTVDDNTLLLSVSALTVSDDYQTSITASSCVISMSFESSTYPNNNQPTPNMSRIDLENGAVVLSGVLTLTGNGSISVLTLPNEDNDDTSEQVKLSMDISGILGSNSGNSFSAPLTGALNYTDDRIRPDGNSPSTSEISGTVNVDIDLSGAANDTTPIIASLSYKLSSPQTQDGASFPSDNNLEIEFNGVIHLTIGNNRLSLDLNVETDRKTQSDQDNVFHFTLNDAIDKNFKISMTLLPESKPDFDANTVTIGNIVVDNIELADIYLKLESGEVIASFDQLNDVLLVSKGDTAATSSTDFRQ